MIPTHFLNSSKYFFEYFFLPVKIFKCMISISYLEQKKNYKKSVKKASCVKFYCRISVMLVKDLLSV